MQMNKRTLTKYSCFHRNGYGLTLDEELHFGTTECCDTFQNEPLNGGKTKFECSQVEVLGFVDDYL